MFLRLQFCPNGVGCGAWLSPSEMRESLSVCSERSEAEERASSTAPGCAQSSKSDTPHWQILCVHGTLASKFKIWKLDH